MFFDFKTAYFCLFAIAMISSGCKPKAISNVQSLENFTFQQRLRTNVCSADKTLRADRLDYMKDIPIEGGSDDMKKLIRTTMTSVPPAVIHFFKQSKGKIHLINNAKQHCEDNIKAQIGEAPRYDEIQSCALQGFRTKIKRNKSGLSPKVPEIDIYLEADEAVIKHYLLRQFGIVYFTMQTYTNGRNSKEEGKGVEVGEIPHQDVAFSVEKIMYAYLLDLTSTDGLPMDVVDNYLGHGAGQILQAMLIGPQHPEVSTPSLVMVRSIETVLISSFEEVSPIAIKSRLANFRAMLAAEAFDSYYCNSWASFERQKLVDVLKKKPNVQELKQALKNQDNTQQIMAVMFPRTFGAFEEYLAPKLDASKPFILAVKENSETESGVLGFALQDGGTISEQDQIFNDSRLRSWASENVRREYQALRYADHAAMLGSMRVISEAHEPFGQRYLKEFDQANSRYLSLKAANAAAEGRQVHVELDRDTHQRFLRTLTPNTGYLGQAGYNDLLQHNAGLSRGFPTGRSPGLGQLLSATPASLERQQALEWQRKIQTGRIKGNEHYAGMLSPYLEGDLRMASTKALADPKLLTDTDRNLLRREQELAERAALVARQRVAETDESFYRYMDNFETNLPTLNQRLDAERDAAFKESLTQRWSSNLKDGLNSMDEASRRAIYSGKMEGPEWDQFVSGQMDKARETEMLNFKAGSDREVGKRAYDSLFLPVASRDPELRIQNAKRSWGGDAAGYRRHTDFAEGKLYNEAGRVFDIYSAPRLRTSAQIYRDIKEQYHRDLSGVADTYFDRVRLASAGVQSTALIPGAGPVLAAPATAVSTGLDATVAVGESVRAAVDPYMENKAGTLAQDYASIIAPGNLGAAKKTFKTFESQIDVMAKMPGAKTIGRLGTPITAYQLGDAGVAVGQMALPKVSPEYAKMQAESARRLQQSAQSTSYWDQTQGIRTDLGYKNHVDTPLVSLSPIERQAAVEMYEISKGVSTNLGGPVGISEFVTQEPANLQPQPQPQSQPQQQPAASSSGSNSIYEVGG